MENEPPLPPPQPVGIYGWRKRCLYAFILLLMVVVIINLALTVWILRVLDFSIDGMGKLRIDKEGLKLEGEAEFLRPLYVKEIKAYDQTLHIESAKGVKIQAREGDGKQGGILYLGDNKLQAVCEAFEVLDKHGRLRLNITENAIVVGVDEMKYPGKAVVESCIHTPTVVSQKDKSLTVSSENSSVHIVGDQGIFIKSSNGDVEIKSYNQIILKSDQGGIYLDAENLFIKNIVVSNATAGGTSKEGVHQLCMCDNGRLFLGPASGDCLATQDTCGGS